MDCDSLVGNWIDVFETRKSIWFVCNGSWPNVI